VHEEELRIAVEGGTLVGHRGGEGPSALVLHGGPALPDYMGGCAELLADRFDCVRYTQRGVTPSAQVGPYTIEAHVADAVQVLDALEIDRAWLVGHSWGGHLALHVLASHADRVAGLICVDPLGAYGDVFEPFGRNLRAKLTPEQGARVDEIEARRRAGEATGRELAERGTMIWGAYFLDPARSLPPPRAMGLECSTEANRSITEHHAAGTLVERLPGLPGRPALFVHGAQDPLPLESSTETAKLVAGARVVVIDGSGHFPWVERPEEFREAVGEFLSSLSDS
jgi:pimeloyl-ACP methyl ester carboxylesterase